MLRGAEAGISEDGNQDQVEEPERVWEEVDPGGVWVPEEVLITSAPRTCVSVKPL